MTMMSVTEENFNREVLSSLAPTFVHFRAPWCGICHLVSPVLDSYKAKWPTPLRIFDVNADENLKLANRYQLKTLPTLLYIENGQVVERLEGFEGHESFRQKIEMIAYRHRLESQFSTKSA